MPSCPVFALWFRPCFFVGAHPKAHGSGGRRSAVPGAARITSRPGAWSTSGPQNTVPLDDYRRVRGSDNPSSLQGLSMVVHASGWVSLLLYVLLYEADV